MRVQPLEAGERYNRFGKARQSVAPKMQPRDRTIYESPPATQNAEQRGFNWVPTAFFGGLLFVALLLRWVTRTPTPEKTPAPPAAANLESQPQTADEEAVS